MQIKIEKTIEMKAPYQIGPILLDRLCNLIHEQGGCESLDCDECIFQDTENYEVFREVMNA